MNVCLVSGAFPPDRCGIGDYTDCLARNLAQLGVEVHIITSSCSQSQPPADLQVHRVVSRWNAVGISGLLAALHRINARIVHIQYPSIAFRRTVSLALLPVLLRLSGRRVIVTLHEYAIAGLISRLRQLLMAAASHEVIATNPEDCSRLRRILFWKKRRVHQICIGANIEPGVSIEQFNRESRRRTFGANRDSLVICFFGNIYPAKGIEDLVDAFGIVNKDVPNSRLVIIGSCDPANTLFSSLLRRKIIDAGLVDKVYVSGFLPKEEVSELLLASDLCVLPFRDGISLRRGSFLAAVKHGLPVITTVSHSTPPEGLVDGENVVLVTAGDVQKLADSITRLLHSPETYIKVKRNLAVLGQRFSWPEIARRTMEVYRSVQGQPNDTSGTVDSR